MAELRDLLARTAEVVVDFRSGLADRRVFPQIDVDQLRSALGSSLPEGPTDAGDVVDALVDVAEPALVATAGPRYFGFVVGGAVDAALCADMLASGWDQVAFNSATSPLAAVVEEVAATWLKDVLGLPSSASVGFVTGAQAANTVALASARQHVLAEAGWDVAVDGLTGAPHLRVVAGEERHATIDRSLRLLGFGSSQIQLVPCDANGAIDIAQLAAVLADTTERPTIACLQAGNVNTGACDDLAAACDLVHRHGGWAHVDGAFGLWAAASSSTRHLVAGIDTADSWACDGHKWLNVPYDSGYVFCAHPDAHAAAMRYDAAYLVRYDDGALRQPADFVPESSRRARGLATWAALRQLGRQGVADLVDRCCALARRFAAALDAADGVNVVNDVVLNQVLVRFGDDTRTQRVIDAVQRGGVCWMGGTTWRGMRLMRISVSNWSTTDADVDRSAAVILEAAAAVRSL